MNIPYNLNSTLYLLSVFSHFLCILYLLCLCICRGSLFAYAVRTDAHVHDVEPCTKTDLTVVSLPDFIHTYNLRAPQNMPVNPLLYLYPDIPKDSAFERYYSKPGTV